MHGLHRYLRQELPIINDFLARETEKLQPLVRSVAGHVLQAGGKRLRPLLTILFARGCGRVSDDVYPLACAMEFFHSATLLHDDILDDSHLRRGITTAHLVFGKTETILAGDVLLALGNRLVAEYGNPCLSLRVSEAIMHTATGEIQELDWINTPTLSQDHYLEIITGKTAFLIQAACHCGAILAGGDPVLEQAALDYGINLGIAFQLTDDALDYEARAEISGKPVGGDLREGKLTLPLILYLEGLSKSRRNNLLSEFTLKTSASKQRTPCLSEQRIAAIIDEVQTSGCVGVTRQRAAYFVNLAAAALEKLPDTAERKVLEEALTHTLQRDK
ncbi:MAG TPA: polyprenyl synthetase family protein [Desulfonatronum sp.]|nr:polyprenyl synthetase family protein [Desulfonatronum sp.]